MYLFLDCETTGLNMVSNSTEIRYNHCMQIAGIITDSKLNELERFNYYVETKSEDYESMNEYVLTMHTKTGLLNTLKDSSKVLPKSKVDTYINRIINKYISNKDKITIVGNNISFDYEVVRQNFPITYNRIKYSMIDVSTIRKAISILDSTFNKKVMVHKKSNHDAIVDIEECIKELNCYLEMIDLNKFKPSIFD